MKRQGKSAELKVKVDIEFKRGSCAYEKQRKSDPFSEVLEMSRVVIGVWELDESKC